MKKVKRSVPKSFKHRDMLMKNVMKKVLNKQLPIVSPGGQKLARLPFD